MVSRPRSARSLSALIRSAPGRAELRNILSELGKESNDRAATITITALLEGALESALLNHFVALTKSDQKDIFGPAAPLSSLSAKIQLGYALELFGKHTRGDLNRIREVRSKSRRPPQETRGRVAKQPRPPPAKR